MYWFKTLRVLLIVNVITVFLMNFINTKSISWNKCHTKATDCISATINIVYKGCYWEEPIKAIFVCYLQFFPTLIISVPVEGTLVWSMGWLCHRLQTYSPGTPLLFWNCKDINYQRNKLHYYLPQEENWLLIKYW